MREEQSLRAEPILNRRNKTEQVFRKDFGIQANQAALSKLNPRDLERIKAILFPAQFFQYSFIKKKGGGKG